MNQTDDINDIWVQYKKSGDPQLQAKLVEHYLPLVRHLSLKILHKLRPGTELEDLVSDGMFGLLRAIDGYDLSRGFKFETYATSVVRGAIFNGLRRMDWLPERTRGKTRALQKAIDKFTSMSGRQPTEDELAQELRISAAEVFELITSLGCVYLLSLDQPLNGNEDSDGVIMDVVASDQQSFDPEREFEFEEQRQRLRNAIGLLNEREQTLIKLHYFQGITFEKISRQLGVSKQRISQMHSLAVRRLRDFIGEDSIEFEAMSSFDIEG